MKIEIYDTTLRDGTQAENFNLSVDDKVRITRQLDTFGIDFIEGGWPGSNPLAVEYFKQMQNISLKQAKLSAFWSTRHFKNPPDKDPNIQALIDAKTPAITIFGKSWDVHVHDALRIGLDDNLQIIEDSLAYLKNHVEVLLASRKTGTMPSQPWKEPFSEEQRRLFYAIRMAEPCLKK
jgi:2-isopropylmalate synthase